MKKVGQDGILDNIISSLERRQRCLCQRSELVNMQPRMRYTSELT